jgi:putative transposase
MPHDPLPEVAAFQAFLTGRVWVFGDNFVSTVGRDEAAIREYIRKQEQEDRRQDQLKLV